MAKVSTGLGQPVQGGSPNLINGVSRQPAELRLPSQLEESFNLFPSVSLGLRPRNPVEYLTALPDHAATSHFHFINRDDAEQYSVSVSGTGIKVSDLTGVPRTVNAPKGYGYLAGATAADIETVSVLDYTFVVNKGVTVKGGTSTAPTRTPEALIHIASAVYNKTYRVYVNDVLVGDTLTPGGSYDTDDHARRAEEETATVHIAHALLNGKPADVLRNNSGDHPDTDFAYMKVSATISAALSPDEWYCRRYGNVLHLFNKLGNDFSVRVECGANSSSGDPSMRAHKGVVSDFSLLPSTGPDGFPIRVAGDRNTNYDDWHATFSQNASSGEGRWEEAVGQGVPLDFDETTMPWVLRREADGTFTFTTAEWSRREAGDLDTNPWPSFVGQQITNAVFHKNRLGFSSLESIAFSRNGDYFNFFISTAQEELDTDPIDVSISYPEISTIQHVVPVSGELILFTTSIPFRFAGGDTLTPKSVSIAPLMTNKSRSDATPVSVGSYVYFANDLEAGSAIHEFVYSPDVEVTEAPAVTDHVQGYLPADIGELVGDDSLKFLLATDKADSSNLFLYKWLKVGKDKVQSAWQKWIMPGRVLRMLVLNDWVYLAGDVSGMVELWRIKLHDSWTDLNGATVHLDRRATLTGAFDASTDATVFSLPYSEEDAIFVFGGGDWFGQMVDGTVSGNTLTVSGDVSGTPVFMGKDFAASGQLSQQFVRTQQTDGSGTAVPGMELRIGAITLETSRSAAMQVDVDRAYRPLYSAKLLASRVGTKTDILGKLQIGRLPGRISVMAKSEDVTVTFRKYGPLSFSVLSFGWTGSAFQNGY